MKQSNWTCKNCSKLHPLYYMDYRNGSQHLMYSCDSNHVTYLIPYVAGLPIPTRQSLQMMSTETFVVEHENNNDQWRTMVEARDIESAREQFQRDNPEAMLLAIYPY